MLVKIDYDAVDLSACTLITVGSRTAVIDLNDRERIAGYVWLLKKTFYNCYAYRKKVTPSGIFRVYMHRQITHCPNDLCVHHLNRNGLDNRQANLELMPKGQHHELHRFR